MRWLVLFLVGCGASVQPAPQRCATTVHVGDDIGGEWQPYRAFECDSWTIELNQPWEASSVCWCHHDNLKDGRCAEAQPCMVDFMGAPLWGEVQ